MLKDLVVGRGCAVELVEEGYMDEHDDDLASEVHEDAGQETDTYPTTGDELEEAMDNETADDGESPNLDDDDTEL